MLLFSFSGDPGAPAIRLRPANFGAAVDAGDAREASVGLALGPVLLEGGRREAGVAGVLDEQGGGEGGVVAQGAASSRKG